MKLGANLQVGLCVHGLVAGSGAIWGGGPFFLKISHLFRTDVFCNL